MEKFLNARHDDDGNNVGNDKDQGGVVDVRGVVREILQILIASSSSSSSCLLSTCEYIFSNDDVGCPEDRCPQEEAFLAFASRSGGSYEEKIQLEVEALEDTLFGGEGGEMHVVRITKESSAFEMLIE